MDAPLTRPSCRKLIYVVHPEHRRGPREMLSAIGVRLMDDCSRRFPKPLQFQGELNIPPRMDQITLARHLGALAQKNVHADDLPCFLGAGIYDHYVPPTVAAITGRSEFLHLLYAISAGSQPGNAAKHLRVPDAALSACAWTSPMRPCTTARRRWPRRRSWPAT